jgi:predicted TIM-barrel fold metal-dependent hydrolase
MALRVSYTRREFLFQAAAVAVLPWKVPVLDIHAHVDYNGRTNEQLLAHCDALNVRKAVLLPAEGSMRKDPEKSGNEACTALMRAHSERFVRFASADLKTSDPIHRIRTFLANGGIGIGEQKFPVACDGPEIRAVYELAAELHVPVLIHFEDPRLNTGFANFPKMVQQYPRTTFIGHAITWWANISIDAGQGSYPAGPIKPGGLTDRLLTDYPNVYADLSANSGRNALTRDPAFARDFVKRHQAKLIFGSDCTCRDGNGAGIADGKCIARECLTALHKLCDSEAMFQRIVWENGTRLLKISA